MKLLFATEDLTNQTTTPRSSQAEPFVQLISHALAYKGLIASVTLLGFVLTGLMLCFVTPTYEGQAVVIVDSRRNKLADDESALSSIVIDQYQTSLKSELELLLSTEVARHVITSLGLLNTPDYAAARSHVSTANRFAAMRHTLVYGIQSLLTDVGLRGGSTPSQLEQPKWLSLRDARHEPSDDPDMANAIAIFRKSFWALNDPKSLTIRLGYRSTSPVLAADATNAALADYLATDEKTKAAAISRSETWLQGRIAVLRTNLNAKEEEVEAFRKTHDLATDQSRSPLQQQLLQLVGRRVDADAALAAARAKVVRDARQVSPDALATSSDTLNSRLIQDLRQREAGLLIEQAQRGAILLPDHPSMLRIASQLVKIRSAIDSEIGRIGQSQGTDVKLAELQSADISSQIHDIQAKINDANAYGIKLQSLEADAAAKRAVLNSFTERYDKDDGSPLTTPDSRVVSWADVPIDASSPKYGLILAGSTLCFAFVGFCLSMALERFRSGFDGMHELSEELGLVVAGLTAVLPRRATRRNKSAAAGDAPSIRELALTVRALAHTPLSNTTKRVVLITSALSGEGKSTLALSLARSVANGGQRCLLIDADIRNPSLHRTLHVPATPGLVEMALDNLPINALTRHVAGEAFDFLPVGRPAQDTLSPFTIESFGRAISASKQHYDVIVIDSAPVLLAAEGLVLSSCADLTLFVVRWRKTPRQIARKAAQMLSRCSAGPCLAVLSQANLRQMRNGPGERVEAQHRAAYIAS